MDKQTWIHFVYQHCYIWIFLNTHRGGGVGGSPGGAIGAAGACTGFTVTYNGALTSVVATGLEAITGAL